MNLQNFNTRIKILFAINILFLTITSASFVAYLVVNNELQKYFWFSSWWFAAFTALLFHYLLWKTLPFFQQIDFEHSSHYSIALTLIFYVLFFPLLCFITVIFLLIFTLTLVVSLIVKLFNKKKSIG